MTKALRVYHLLKYDEMNILYRNSTKDNPQYCILLFKKFYRLKQEPNTKFIIKVFVFCKINRLLREKSGLKL